MTSFTSRYGNPAVDYKGAHVRAHFRHAATGVAISGRVDASNADWVAECVNRFVLADKPFVLDLTGVDACTPQAVRLLFEVDDRCNTSEVDWAVVGLGAYRDWKVALGVLASGLRTGTNVSVSVAALRRAL